MEKPKRDNLNKHDKREIKGSKIQREFEEYEH